MAGERLTAASAFISTARFLHVEIQAAAEDLPDLNIHPAPVQTACTMTLHWSDDNYVVHRRVLQSLQYGIQNQQHESKRKKYKHN